ncbi:alpha/beta fold hydrolase [Actinotalea sp. K2]|uniref:alpha/beta fold hydrolase n=1 Tax=Actinotalea sp. K2 TaxID=2939438 RepID=UPI0020179DC2|nr:alpha/beta hydrolase [Actinotalea sp. K2]MCL3859675.1 alpha/beta hydrolase [Actinotalea sp. K2]
MTTAIETDTRRPRTGILLGVLVALIGTCVAGVWAVTGVIDQTQRPAELVRTPIPGAVTVEITRPGLHVVHYEGRSPQGLPLEAIEVVDPTGARVEVEGYERDLRYDAPNPPGPPLAPARPRRAAPPGGGPPPPPPPAGPPPGGGADLAPGAVRAVLLPGAAALLSVVAGGVLATGASWRPRAVRVVRCRPGPRTAIVGATTAAGLLGLAIGTWMPRGPLTTVESLGVLTCALAVGGLTGWLLRSRWAALLTVMVTALVVEAFRLGSDLPTLGGVRLGGLAEWGVLIAGRGFDALVIGMPAAVGALLGAAAARRAAGIPRPGGFSGAVRRAGLGLAALALLGLVAGLVRPAGTEPILGADGAPVVGSIAELTTVRVGGYDQGIMLRGRDVDAPVLLFLEGGPGGTAVGAMRYAGEGLEEHFVVATWDQRGTGRSVRSLDPGTLTVDRLVQDTIEVAEHLCDRFGEDGVYLVGSSWGTTLDVLAVQQRPDLFTAYVGTGQMVDQQATDLLMYDEVVDYAARVGDAALAERLATQGPPPYQDTMAYSAALASNPEWMDFPHGHDYDWRVEYPMSLFTAEYTLTEQFRSVAGLVDTFAVVYPQLQDVDLRRDAPRLEVPVYLVQGAHEVRGRAVLADEWFALLVAPHKERVVLDRSGHTPHRDEPARFAEVMARVLAETAAP